MTVVIKYLKILIGLIVISGIFLILVKYYSIIFSKKVVGEVVGVEKIEVPVAMITRSTEKMNPQLFSFAVAIKDSNSHEIFTSSAEDRQWAVVQKGQCAEAVFLPYPPWVFEKEGTYYGARLIRLFECGK